MLSEQAEGMAGAGEVNRATPTDAKQSRGHFERRSIAASTLNESRFCRNTSSSSAFPRDLQNRVIAALGAGAGASALNSIPCRPLNCAGWSKVRLHRSLTPTNG